MKRLTILFVLLLTACIGFSQIDYAKEIKEDLVKIEAGYYTAQEYSLLTFSNGTIFQLKLSATCPVDVASRDFFVSFYSSYLIILLYATFSEIGELPVIKEIDELIGDPDITYNFIMTKNGIQIQIISSEGQENQTMHWQDVFGQ